MDQIRKGQIKMRPRIYFIIGSVLTFLGLTFSIFTSVFLISLFKFSWRTYGPMADYRVDRMLSIFPWWLLVIAIMALIIGIWLIRHYSFSYKVNFKLIIIGFIVTVLLVSWLIDLTRIDDNLMKHRPMRGIKQYFHERSVRPCLKGSGACSNPSRIRPSR